METLKQVVDFLTGFITSEVGQLLLVLLGTWIGKHSTRGGALFLAALKALDGKSAQEVSDGGNLGLHRAQELTEKAHSLQDQARSQGRSIPTKTVALLLALDAVTTKVKKK